jgi:hypothetical protein
VRVQERKNANLVQKHVCEDTMVGTYQCAVFRFAVIMPQVLPQSSSFANSAWSERIEIAIMQWTLKSILENKGMVPPITGKKEERRYLRVRTVRAEMEIERGEQHLKRPSVIPSSQMGLPWEAKTPR